MTDIKIIEELVAKELEEANKAHPPFVDGNHAYGVIIEEVEEAQAELKWLMAGTLEFWQDVKSGDGIADSAKQVKAFAIGLAQEAIQVAAMAQKALDSL